MTETTSTAAAGQVWPIPAKLKAAREKVYEIHHKLETDCRAIDNYAKAFYLLATSTDLGDQHGDVIMQLAEDLTTRVDACWDGIERLMKMLPPELQDYLAFDDGEDEADDGNGEVEQSAGDLGGEHA